MSGTLLEVKDLKVDFPVRRGGRVWQHKQTLRAVDGVSLTVADGEVVGLVGESGCGKSTLARTVAGLQEATEGEVRFEGYNLLEATRREWHKLRPRLQMVFQDPDASLNPRKTVYATLAEPLRVHRIASPAQLKPAVSALMERVGLSPRFMRKYPHEFSGGQRQRIAIARALAPKPRLLLADEPVSALDVSIQAQILNLLRGLCGDMNLAMLFISHDLAVVRFLANRIYVMYLGAIVEQGPAQAIFENPRHPYTQALLKAIPEPDPERARLPEDVVLKGDPPSPLNPPQGCRFHPRCPYATEACKQERPPLLEAGPEQQAACIRLDVVPSMAPAGAATDRSDG